MKTRLWILVGSVAILTTATAGAQPLDFTLNTTPAISVDLGGQWKIARDPSNEGKTAGWFRRGPVAGAVPATVPNPLELTFPGYDGVVWYWRSFEAGDLLRYDDLRIHFQGADYFAEAWLNGHYIGGNESALLPFAFGAKEALRVGTNELVVRVVDASYAKEVDGFQLGHVPGGRQADDPLQPGWRHENYGGLLLPVSVQAFRRPWIADGFIRPDIAHSRIDIDLLLVGAKADDWIAVIRPVYPRPAKPALQKTVRIAPDGNGRASISLDIPNPRLWQIWDGYLYQLELSPKGGSRAGTVWRDRFGMREISIRNGRIAVNGKQILQRSFLYNEIWPVTLGVPYKDLARRDIELTRRANANMLRCFSKTPVPATVQAADEVGILLQPESLASWYLERGEKEHQRLKNISERNVLLYRNHPSIVWWNILNENSPKEDPKNKSLLGPFALREILPSLHQLDPTRPAIANDPIWRETPNIWEPGQSAPTLPLVQEHYYQFTGLENHEDSWTKIRGRAWGQPPRPGTEFVGVTEWGQNSAPEWERLIDSYRRSGVREDAEDYVAYRKLLQMNRRHYEEAGLADLGFPTFESVQAANRETVAQRYREHYALFWGNVNSVGEGMTSLEDSSYEFSGVVDNWRNPKPVVFETLAELNRPLQVSLWLRPSAVYAGEKITFDATLVNEAQRLAPGNYTLTARLLDAARRAAGEQKWQRRVQGEPIEYLLTESLPAPAFAGLYRLELELAAGGKTLTASKPVQVFERNPRKVASAPAVWLFDSSGRLEGWFGQRGITPRRGTAAEVRAGEIIVVAGGAPDAAGAIQAAIRRGARGLLLNPETLLDNSGAAAGGEHNYAALLEPLSAGWKPALREITWWGTPGVWGYSRAALALKSSFLTGLPQGVAFEAQPAYQRLAPKYTFLMDDQPPNLRMERAVIESSLHVDAPYTSDLFVVSFGEGLLVLNTLHLAENAGVDPAADLILENIMEYLGRHSSVAAR